MRERERERERDGCVSVRKYWGKGRNNNDSYPLKNNPQRVIATGLLKSPPASAFVRTAVLSFPFWEPLAPLFRIRNTSTNTGKPRTYTRSCGTASSTIIMVWRPSKQGSSRSTCRYCFEPIHLQLNMPSACSHSVGYTKKIMIVTEVTHLSFVV